MAERNAPFVVVDKATGLPVGIVVLTSHDHVITGARNVSFIVVYKSGQRFLILPIDHSCYAAVCNSGLLIIFPGKPCSGEIVCSHRQGNQLISFLFLFCPIGIRVIPPVYLLSGPRRCLCQIFFILRLVTINLAVLDKSVFLIFISEAIPGNHTVHYAAIADLSPAGRKCLLLC